MINHKFVPYPLIFNFKDEILLVIYVKLPFKKIFFFYCVGGISHQNIIVKAVVSLDIELVGICDHNFYTKCLISSAVLKDRFFLPYVN